MGAARLWQPLYAYPNVPRPAPRARRPTWALARADDLRDHGLSDGLDLLGEALS
jgi:hypothetical protein